MIVTAIALLLAPAPGKPACVAWRDPSGGKLLDARAMQERRDAARRTLVTDLGRGSNPIQESRATPTCALRAGETMPAPSPTPAN